MPKMGAFICSQRFIELKNALKKYIKRKPRKIHELFRRCLDLGMIINVLMHPPEIHFNFIELSAMKFCF
jgi:uncharacterized protein YbgA (DUF1722 family)